MRYFYSYLYGLARTTNLPRFNFKVTRTSVPVVLSLQATTQGKTNAIQSRNTILSKKILTVPRNSKSEEAEERLDQVKVSQAFSDAVISSLEDFLDNTDPFLYEVLKGHINQMFEGE